MNMKFCEKGTGVGQPAFGEKILVVGGKTKEVIKSSTASGAPTPETHILILS